MFFSEKDRPTELIPKLKGVLTNPNCEFHPNFVAIHTLATWCKASADGGSRDVEMGERLFLCFPLTKRGSLLLCRNLRCILKHRV